MLYQIEENGLHLAFEMKEGQPVYLFHLGVEPMKEKPQQDKKFLYTMQEIQVTGESRTEHFGVSPNGTLPGNRMFYVGHDDEKNENGRVLRIHTMDEKTGLAGTMTYQFYDGIPVMRCYNTVTNEGNEELGLEVVTTFVQQGAVNELEEDVNVMIPHNSWQQEIQWREDSVNHLGSHYCTDAYSPEWKYGSARRR